MDTFSVASKSVATASGGSTQAFGQAIYTTPSPSTPKTTGAGTGVAAQVPSPERVAQAIKQVNSDFTQKGQDLYASFERDKATGINVVKIMDKNTLEVIGQFPPKEIIAIAEEIDRNQEGKGHLMHTSV